MTINIVESNQGFAPHTVISPAARHESTVINIGHVDEVHYISTIPCNREMTETNLSSSNQHAQIIGNERVTNILSKEDKRACRKEWMRKKRANKEFRDKENRAKKDKRSAEMNNSVQSRKRKQSTKPHGCEHELLQPPKKKQNCSGEENIHEVETPNVIQAFHDSIMFGPEYV